VTLRGDAAGRTAHDVEQFAEIFIDQLPEARRG
jgi:hypothetical protein